MVGTLIGTGKEEVGIGMGAVDAECALGDDVLHLLRMSKRRQYEYKVES